MIIGLIVMTIIPAILVGQSIRVLTPEGDTVTITNENNPLASRYGINDYSQNSASNEEFDRKIQQIDENCKKELAKIDKEYLEKKKKNNEEYEKEKKKSEKQYQADMKLFANIDKDIEDTKKMSKNSDTSTSTPPFFLLLLFLFILSLSMSFTKWLIAGLLSSFFLFIEKDSIIFHYSLLIFHYVFCAYISARPCSLQIVSSGLTSNIERLADEI